jgi:hypothetical protein
MTDIEELDKLDQLKQRLYKIGLYSVSHGDQYGYSINGLNLSDVDMFVSELERLSRGAGK